jgi:hypothetical protein
MLFRCFLRFKSAGVKSRDGGAVKVPTSSCTWPLFFSYFNETYFLCRFSKVLKYLISRNSIHWELSRITQTDRWTDGQTDMMKLTVVFRNFANAPRKWQYQQPCCLYSPLSNFTNIHTACQTSQNRHQVRVTYSPFRSPSQRHAACIQLRWP